MRHILLNRVLALMIWLAFGIVLSVSTTNIARSQQFKWMNVGSLQNWFSSQGCEEEVGFVNEQQYGLQWPAIYHSKGLVDMQAAKAMWIAVDQWTYPNATVAPYVVHIGPRVHGYNEMISVKFDLISKLNPAVQVLVDGNVTEGKSADPDSYDATIPSDRMILNIVNTTAGITMVRKIMQFSQQYNENYMIYDYVFKNTGNTSKTDTSTLLPGKTLTGVYFYFQYRYAVCADTRYVIGQNPTGWGINEMNDFRGDSLAPATPFFTDPVNSINYNIRANYSWHGFYPPFQSYNNIGGPIWTPYYDKTDTTGRLGASQFVGTVVLHADKSATDKLNDPWQPRTTSYEGSDEGNTSGNDATNAEKAKSEYAWITRGHRDPRMADKVGPPPGDPAIGTPGGWSSAIGFGPYTLAPGQSIHLAIAEGAAGLSRDANIKIGRQYKAAGGGNPGPNITYSDGSLVSGTKSKNDWVYTSRDSLFLTFNRAMANYNSGYTIPQPPLPPMNFTVKSAGDRIGLSWEKYGTGGPAVDSFQIFRALGRFDSTYYRIASVGASTTSYEDLTPVRGLDYYYYIVSVGKASDNTGTHDPLVAPAGQLISNRYYTQTYLAANLKRAPVPNMTSIRVVPNPYNISASSNLLYSTQDRIGFLDVPGVCTIKIYTELGELVTTLNHDDNSGDAYWNMTTSSQQIVVSGLYIAVFEKPTGERAFRKFVIIR